MTPQFITDWIKKTAASVTLEVDRKAQENGLPLLPVHRELVEDAAAQTLHLGLLVAYTGMCGIHKLPPEQYTEIENWVRHEAGLSSHREGASVICDCGSNEFVWWIAEQKQFSSPTFGENFDAQRHPSARCVRCNKEWTK